MAYKLGLVSISFRKHTPKEILSAMNTAGLSVIEWGSDVHAPADDPARLKELAALQEAHGIRCCSYGTYFKLGVTPLAELERYIDAAKVLGTDILRLWCGSKNSEDYTPGETAELFAQCKAAAAIAQRRGVTLCMECHNNTYTNRRERALALMQAVDSPHFRMYWQPNQFRSTQENLQYAALLAPYTAHLHVFNWEGNETYPLAGALPLWRGYLQCFPGDKCLLLEFMPDGNLTSLETEARALRQIAGGSV